MPRRARLDAPGTLLCQGDYKENEEISQASQ
jgi:hypothetical protein